MKHTFLVLTCFLAMVAGCKQNKTVPGVYRHYCGQREGYDIWIVDGYMIRRDIYKEFLYGGNEQRYLYVPEGEIWVDHAISSEEYELTVIHELNERHLMAKFGWTYDKSHDSSLALEVVLRQRFDSLSRSHEASLKAVSPTDWNNIKEIHTLPDSIRLNNIYRIPVGTRNGLGIWIVDGYLVRKNIFPDFGFSGNDAVYHFIPSNEIWIDGQVSGEEMEYSILAELKERSLMKQGQSFSDAYESSVEEIRALREKMAARVKEHPSLVLPDSLARDSGQIDPSEK
jgi:hypothetical protein